MVVASVFRDRNTGMLIPLILGVIVSGLVFGVRLADARTMTGERRIETKSARISALLKSLPVGTALIAFLVFGIVAWSFSQSNAYQADKASQMLKADSFRNILTVGENSVLRGALPLALRTRNALERYGEHAAAEQISNLIHEAVQTFAQTPSRYHERYRNPDYQPPDIGAIAHALKVAGRPDELAHLLEIAREQLMKASALSMIAAARAEGSFGSKEKAVNILRSVLTKLRQQDWFERSSLVHAFFELGHVDTAKELLIKLTTDITEQSANDPISLIWLDRLSPEIGDILWRTGLWNELPQWRGELSEVLAVAIEGMCRRGEREAAIVLI
jgi:hypothetical protein